ncbi:MAG: hypothetical protein MZU97_26860 [Bacillus subtilis]|nr:hypothetical protein [Bacillus subtilis]
MRLFRKVFKHPIGWRLGAGLVVSGKKPSLNPEIIESETLLEELDSEPAESPDSEKLLEELLDDENEVEELTEDHKNCKTNTLYVKQTLRSGQTVNYDGNVVIIGDCHPGSEISACGDITVWGILGGIAHAGSAGNSSACIRALKINAIQLRISWFICKKTR